MKRIVILALLVSSIVSVAWANTRTVKLSVPSMNCAICPITVRKALEKVDGVMNAQVSYETKSAMVIFDDQITNTAKLMKATHNAGFPSTEMKEE